MKIAAFGDNHAHMFTDFAEVDVETGNTRFTQQLKALRYMRKYCVDNAIKIILFAGDLFHKRKAVDTVTFNMIHEEIKAFGEDDITVIMIPGNHDQVDNSDFPEHSLKAFKELDNVVLLDKFHQYYHVEEDGEVFIYPAPYSKNAAMVKEEINKYAENAKNHPECANILLGHLGISGAFVGKGSYAMSDAFSYEDLRPDAFDFGVFGHFHKRQFLGGNPNYFYTGAPIQHSFNDEGEDKGFMVMDTEEKTSTFVPIPAPKFITVKVKDPSEIENMTKELEGNFIRFQVDAEKVDKLIEQIPEGQKFRVEAQKEFKEERRVDVDLSMSFAEIITEYAKKFNPGALEVGLDILREVEGK
ncbi:hydrolase activity protein [Lysinibacillus phage vB_LfM_LysYB1]|nr:hydrolase activity protein [Lysinibacillus phage vB_LfM_LysYB1]WAB25227.1 hydrolase activity protein [Lysinibacillus phage vB_LfM_LysYB2]